MSELKIDTTYSTSDALRRYSKSSGQQTAEADEKDQQRPPQLKLAKASDSMDRLTLSREAVALKTGLAIPQKAATSVAGTQLLYNARAHLVNQ